jgi:catechol 2,3-dioxygenase-like lactoylglutathione lyase family enzyme
MALAALDHVTLRTARLGELTTFYARVLGLRPGKRPPFGFGGSWLYCGGRAALHLVEAADLPGAPPSQTGQAPCIEHFAFRAENLAAFLAHLRAHDVAYRTAVVPGLEIRQVHLRDTDGNHVEIAFAPEEKADLGDYPGG